MKKIIYLAAFCAFLLTSCNDYLDTVQNKGNDEVLSSSKQVEPFFATGRLSTRQPGPIPAHSKVIGWTMNLTTSWERLL